ncbi:hypothetical protein QBC34DRAFT_387428 [Podospora aff. communis PSN243]|uniref:Uncharacterized protein n=1 Tax=Podospora aff. communis PSN243 TaxID=3040156 RepID=A0AAV9G3A5_9PEZI|nr:hypothetical protein QBC34DRAFT_387428 [Podospora aff. communis PSN243]
MDSKIQWFLGAGDRTVSAPPPAHLGSGNGTPVSSGYTSDADNLEKQLPVANPTAHTIYKRHAIKTQRAHFLASIGESVSVSLGLGSAVGIWACIHETLKTATGGNTHIVNWTAGPLMGFFLAPLFEKGARVFVGRAGTVLAKPPCPDMAARVVDNIIAITSALLGLGLCKAVQMQYGPLHSSLAFEYLAFAIGFGAFTFVRTILYTLATGHEYEMEKVECRWSKIPSVMFWEYLDHFRHVYIVIAVNIRDSLTFATYPYLMAMWFGYWKTVNPEGDYAWVPNMLNIGFFFTYFCCIKEVCHVLGRVFGSEHLSMHRHHVV